MATSCLKSLNVELNDNPLDLDYEGGFVVVDGYTYENKIGSIGEECRAVINFHLDPLAMKRLNRIDMSDYEVRLNIQFNRITADNGAVQTQPVSKKKLEDYAIDSVYTSKSSYWLYNPDDMFCPEIYLTYKCLSCPPYNSFTGQTVSQFLECFGCGG